MMLQLLRQNWRHPVIEGYILAAFCLITMGKSLSEIYVQILWIHNTRLIYNIQFIRRLDS